ncbi:transglycosylase SLT domain-containing protein [Actinoplanes italicus]|uniref:Transglycosylase-like protein with SLT domain n=1 Tax=Actinoplanes italicus TaxID=113567 RepID=A0A2T0KK60_9ACTN|nr:transglycosylase SLT domain-containing protein [Actinoplanes italicus]PRX23912.1 transglycosylase-like protein with SLT domain [Actinoplanes italicus]
MSRRIRIVAAVTALLVVAGCGQAGAGEKETVAAQAPVSVAPTVEETTPEPDPEPTTEKPKPKPTTKKPTAKPSPTEDPFNMQLPDCAEYVGKAVSRAKAKTALNAAATKVYWPGSAPKLKVPADLIRAVAWHESGWVSNIRNCDGGYGLMQVMPDTQDFVNQRFEKSYDSKDYRQNAMLGANYLAWLTKYFGEKYFKKNYDLSASKCKSDASPCLLNLVADAYNMGFGSTEEAYLDGKKLSNPEYVHLIRANMRECDCDRF